MATQLILRRAMNGLAPVTAHDAEILRVREKRCAECGKVFFKDPRNTWAYWERAKYCGQACSGLGVAKTKDANRPSIEEKFWSNVEKTDGCWLWTGYSDKDGYGVLVYEGKFYRCPSFSLKLDGRPVPKGRFACHTCDTPACVKPEHLYVGTPSQNVQDALSRNRMLVGSRHYASKLTEADIPKIRTDPRTHEIIASAYKVSASLVGLIKSRKIWRHVP